MRLGFPPKTPCLMAKLATFSGFELSAEALLSNLSELQLGRLVALRSEDLVHLHQVGGCEGTKP